MRSHCRPVRPILCLEVPFQPFCSRKPSWTKTNVFSYIALSVSHLLSCLGTAKTSVIMLSSHISNWSRYMMYQRPVKFCTILPFLPNPLLHFDAFKSLSIVWNYVLPNSVPERPISPTYFKSLTYFQYTTSIKSKYVKNPVQVKGLIYLNWMLPIRHKGVGSFISCCWIERQMSQSSREMEATYFEYKTSYIQTNESQQYFK